MQFESAFVMRKIESDTIAIDRETTVFVMKYWSLFSIHNLSFVLVGT